MRAAPPKRSVLGVNISTTSYEEVASVCKDWISAKRSRTGHEPSEAEQSKGRYICVTSVHGIMTSRKDPTVRCILNKADIATPDGMPVVWALRSLGQNGQQRVYGPTLMKLLCAEAERFGHRIYLYGGRSDTLSVLRHRLGIEFPNLRLVGSYSPPFRSLTDEENDKLKAAIRESDPDIIFVGISTPKQEKWMFEHRYDFPGVIMVGVGAAFDFHAGRVQQAPHWMQRAGLEWLFRLGSEPLRLWKRYLLVTPLFLPLWGLQKAGVLKYDDGASTSDTLTS